MVPITVKKEGMVPITYNTGPFRYGAQCSKAWPSLRKPDGQVEQFRMSLNE